MGENKSFGEIRPQELQFISVFGNVIYWDHFFPRPLKRFHGHCAFHSLRLDKNTFYDIKNNTKKYAYGVDPEIVKEDSRERNDPSTGNVGCCWQYGCGTYALNCNCFCDPICIFFDDCCEDVATYCQEETQDSSETMHKKLLE